MKKVFLFFGLVTLGITSCSKDYTCECNQYDKTTAEFINGTTENKTISASSKEEAVEECLKIAVSQSKSCVIK